MSRVLVIYGENKTGKTTLAMTAPGKIGWHELDVGGLQRASWRFPGWEENVSLKKYVQSHINLKNLLTSKAKETRVEGAIEVLENFLLDYIQFLGDDNYHTLVIDPYPKLWKLVCDAELQGRQEKKLEQELKRGKIEAQIALPQSLMPRDYGNPNKLMRGLIEKAKEADKNLILIGFLQDEYVSRMNQQGQVQDVASGKRIPANWKWDNITQELDIAVETYKQVVDVYNEQIKQSEKKNLPHCKIVVSGEGLALEGMELMEPTWDMLDSLIKAAKGES